MEVGSVKTALFHLQKFYTESNPCLVLLKHIALRADVCGIHFIIWNSFHYFSYLTAFYHSEIIFKTDHTAEGSVF